MRRGFTLVEIMVVVSLMILAFGFVIANFQKSSRKQKAIAAAERVVQLLKQAKSNSLAGKKEDCIVCTADSSLCKCSGTDNLCGTRDDLILTGWKVTFDTSVKKVSVDGVCGAVEFTNSDGENLQATVDITLSGSQPSGTAVLFKSLGQGVEIIPDLMPASEFLEVIVADNSVGYSRSIQIYRSGEIQ